MRIAAFVGAILLVACANNAGPQDSDEELKALATLIDRSFATSPDDSDNQIIDRRVRVSSPELDGIWFYTQLNTGTDEKLYRQRLSNLIRSEDGSTIVQKTYRLKTPEQFENAWEKRTSFSALSLSDFEPYFESGCDQHWTNHGQAWHGYVDPKTCTVFSKRRNVTIRIESEARLSTRKYETNERGYDMEMNQLWGTAPDEFITLFPVK